MGEKAIDHPFHEEAVHPLVERGSTEEMNEAVFDEAQELGKLSAAARGDEVGIPEIVQRTVGDALLEIFLQHDVYETKSFAIGVEPMYEFPIEGVAQLLALVEVEAIDGLNAAACERGSVSVGWVVRHDARIGMGGHLALLHGRNLDAVAIEHIDRRGIVRLLKERVEAVGTMEQVATVEKHHPFAASHFDTLVHGVVDALVGF